MPRIICVIPARYASSRFPGKPLALLLGTPMIQHVWQRCQEARCFDEVRVATDDPRIAEVVARFGGAVSLTSPTAASGTERVAELARASSGADDQVFVNVQGDEPAIDPRALATLVAAFVDPQVQMATLVRPLEERERANPNVVKVVRDELGGALYFSRHDLPFANALQPIARWAHVGVYGYRRATLLRLAALPVTALERAESLEQLRALGNGVKIRCCETNTQPQAVDTPADLAPAEAALARLGARAKLPDPIR